MVLITSIPYTFICFRVFLIIKLIIFSIIKALLCQIAKTPEISYPINSKFLYIKILIQDKKMKKIIFSKDTPLKILLFRTDRLGDVVLTIECIEALKTAYPKSEIFFALQSYTAPIVENNPFLDGIILTDAYEQKKLIEVIKSKNFDVSISFFASKIACYAPFFAKIPIRIGPFSKIRALLFNHKILQKRSLGDQNEAEYNLDLLKPLGCEKKYFPKIYLNSKEKKQGQIYLQKKFSTKADKVIFLHPGSGGSSQDWKVENYFLLAEKILSKKIAQVLITGSLEELINYENRLNDHPLLNKNNLLEEQKPLREFLSIISCANIFISNSTGPLHCASALGCKTIGFYPLTKTCKPQRWGTFSDHPQKNLILTPKKENYSPQIHQAIPFEKCMDTITIENAFEAIKVLF